MRSTTALVTLSVALVGAAAPNNSRNSFLVQKDQLPFSDSREGQKVGDSYAGHIVVRKTSQYEAGLFYWYLKAEEHASNAPLVMCVASRMS